MAESHDGYDAIASINVDALRDTLRRTMVLGLPNEDSEKPTFFWERVVTWSDHDSENNPWDWTDAPLTESQPSPVAPIVAYEFFAPIGRQGTNVTEVGDFNFTSIIFTMFEDEFASVAGSSYATIGPSSKKFYFKYYRPAVALGGMTVYQVYYSADGAE